MDFWRGGRRFPDVANLPWRFEQLPSWKRLGVVRNAGQTTWTVNLSADTLTANMGYGGRLYCSRSDTI